MRWAALRTVVRLAALLAIAGCFPSQARAEVRVQVEAGHPANRHIAVSGRIDLFTLYSFVRVMSDPRVAEDKRTAVKLDSEGGSVTAAMAVGHIIRDRGFVTGVDRSGKCLSACVLLLAAGAERVVASSRVGVHRPRADLALMASSTASQARASYGQVVDAMRDYLKAMGMSDALLAAMMEVPSHRMRMLTHRETVAFGLSSGAAEAVAPAHYAYDRPSIGSRSTARRTATAGRAKPVASRKAKRTRVRSVQGRSRLAATRRREFGSFIVRVHRDRAASAGAVGSKRRLRLMLLQTLVRESFGG